MKAYKIICEKYYPGSVAYYANITASKARYDAWLDIRDSHRKALFGDVRVLRASKFDNLAIRPGNIDGLVLPEIERHALATQERTEEGGQ